MHGARVAWKHGADGRATRVSVVERARTLLPFEPELLDGRIDRSDEAVTQEVTRQADCRRIEPSIPPEPVKNA